MRIDLQRAKKLAEYITRTIENIEGQEVNDQPYVYLCTASNLAHGINHCLELERMFRDCITAEPCQHKRTFTNCAGGTTCEDCHDVLFRKEVTCK
jgi:hypothetical protein